MSASAKKGYLYKLPQRGIVKKWNKRWFVLHRTSHEGVVRIEYFDSEECALADQSRRTIPLRDSSRVEQTTGNKVHPYIFQFNSQIGHHVLAADSQTDMDEWIKGIKDAVHEDRLHMRRKKTQSMVVKRSGDEYPSESVGKGYASKLDSGVYRVTLEENETIQKLNLQGAYNLEINPTHLSLTNTVTGAAIAKWHYKNLKSYGKKSGKFHFEVGKASQTGPGQFMCVSTCSKEIFGIVNNNIKRLRAHIDSSTMRKQESEPGLRKSQTMQARATTNSSFQRPRSRQSASDIAGEGVSGNYRTSKDLEETLLDSDPAHLYSVVQKKSTTQANILSKTDLENNYSMAEDDPFLQHGISDTQQEDPSQLYSKVMKSRKVGPEQNKGKADPLAPAKTKKQSTSTIATASIMSTQPYSTPFDTHEQGGGGMTTATIRFSYDSTRDSRDSALVNIDGSIFDSVAEGSTMSPMSSGVHNPLGNSDTLDFGQLNDNFFDRLDQMDHQQEHTSNDPWLAARDKSTASALNTGTSLPQQDYDRIWDDKQTTTNF